jgi:hypothetical protein
MSSHALYSTRSRCRQQKLSARIPDHPGWVYPPVINTSSSTLVCPRCGEGCLHHSRVVVFDRRQDDVKLTKTVVDRGVTVKTIRAQGSGNPSYRRHGLVIQFWCESCDRNFELTISQHKGNTFFRWR